MSKEIRNIPEDVACFITRSDEEFFLSKRKHIYVLFVPLTTTLLLTGSAIASVFILQRLFPNILFPTLLLGIILIILLLAMSLVINFFVNWYFHVYIVTSRKLLEVCYKPFSSKEICVIPLDQMRCIEITTVTHGFIKTLLDIGNVSIRLDLLTHQNIFTIEHISSPQKTGIYLTELLNDLIASRFTNNPVIVPLPIQQAEPVIGIQSPTIVSQPVKRTPVLQNNIYTLFPQYPVGKGG
jgi:hypothetical protein